MQATAALGIICKAPRPGMSKTRLKGVFEQTDAAQLSGAFIRDVASAIEDVRASVGRQGYAVYAPAGSERELKTFLPPTFELLLQSDRDFGVVLCSAAGMLLARGHDCVLLINSDSPTLPVSLLERAITTLRAPGDRVVLGPSIDGGYYLIGLKRAYAALFANIPWSTPEVLATTVERAAEIGLNVTLLPTWYDIDDADSFRLLQAELAGRPPAFAAPGLAGGPAPATRAFLACRTGESVQDRSQMPMV